MLNEIYILLFSLCVSTVTIASENKLLISVFCIFEQAARQSQIPPDSYEKHRDHPDDGKWYCFKKKKACNNSVRNKYINGVHEFLVSDMLSVGIPTWVDTLGYILYTLKEKLIFV